MMTTKTIRAARRVRNPSVRATAPSRPASHSTQISGEPWTSVKSVHPPNGSSRAGMTPPRPKNGLEDGDEGEHPDRRDDPEGDAEDLDRRRRLRGEPEALPAVAQPGPRRGHRRATGVVKNGISRHVPSSGARLPGGRFARVVAHQRHAHRLVSRRAVLVGDPASERHALPLGRALLPELLAVLAPSVVPVLGDPVAALAAGRRRRCRPRGRRARRRRSCCGADWGRRRPTLGRGRSRAGRAGSGRRARP